MAAWRMGPMLRRFLFGRPHSPALFHYQSTPSHEDVPRIPPELRSAWHSPTCNSSSGLHPNPLSEILRLRPLATPTPHPPRGPRIHFLQHQQFGLACTKAFAIHLRPTPLQHVGGAD
eukprot:scaffold547_cov87-Skeletonema_dohrnii-CCMP3373.AAC.2